MVALCEAAAMESLINLNRMETQSFDRGLLDAARAWIVDKVQVHVVG